MQTELINKVINEQKDHCLGKTSELKQTTGTKSLLLSGAMLYYIQSEIPFNNRETN